MENTNSTTQKEDKRANEIIRIQKKQHNFVMLDKGFLEDERLSFKAKGILGYLLSKPDNWKVIIKDLVNHSADGAKSIYSGLRELKKYGYYKKVPVRDVTNSVISYWESVIYECPQDEQKSRFPISKASKSTVSPLLAAFVHVDNVQEQKEYIQNGQRNNININKEKDYNENEISIYPSKPEKPTEEKNDSIDEIDTEPTIKIYTPEEVAEKICLDKLREEHEDKQEEINIIYDCMCEILTDDNPVTANPTVRIAKQNIPYITVKNIFKQLENEHIEYVIDSLNNNGNKYNINKNTKSYFMTSLFSAPRTITHYYKRDFKKDENKTVHKNGFDVDKFLEMKIRKTLKF